MRKTLLFIFSITFVQFAFTQNLVVNPGAEDLPYGTGWTIVNAGTTACSSAPTNTYNNWTMIPDGSANHPFDHTSGAAGGTIFFAGCNPFSFPAFTRFELFQDIDVSADATNIDLGTVPFTFSGYMQTPVSSQTDRGRFIVEYLDASNALLGSSYTSSWQSNFTGSGTAWTSYTNTTLAPLGTRKVRIRLQAELNINQFEINVYFDDISLTTPNIVPVKLTSFTATEEVGEVNLNWKTEDELNLSHYELEQSIDGVNFTRIATVASGRSNYSLIDKNISSYSDKYYYRLKMVDEDGTFSYSKIISVKIKGQQSFVLSPNPAKGFVTVSGLNRNGIMTIINTNGSSVLTYNISSQSNKIDISALPPGLYFVRLSDGKTTGIKKLVVQK